jgi:dihydropteroate synthase
MSNGAWYLARGRTLALEPFALMGILNVTPDSFSDGGQHLDPVAATARALAMAAEGATMVDVGGESTRPGASPVPAAEQIARVIPVIRGIRDASDVAISVDTTSAEVAKAALDAGADAVNDQSAGEGDPGMFPLVAERGAGLCLMHRVRPPTLDAYSHSMPASIIAGDVVKAVNDYLIHRAFHAMEAGVARPAIAVDPGLGFGKTVEQNFMLIARADELAALGFPVVFGASRKSFLGKASGVEVPAERAAGSVIAAASAWSAGVRVFRVHDVAATRQALLVAKAILEAGPLD